MKDFDLMQIDSYIKHYAKVISDLLEVNVDIVNSSSKRISGTGNYSQNFYFQGNVFKLVIDKRVPIFIESPREHTICKDCPNICHCIDKVEVACPIILDNQILGVISITCSDSEKSAILCNNQEKYTNFLVNMADLIAVKAREMIDSTHKHLMQELQNKLINLISDSVIVFDSKNKIQFINRRVEVLLSHKFSQLQYLTKIGQLTITQYAKSKQDNSAEFVIRIRDSRFHISGELFYIQIDKTKAYKIFLFNSISSDSDNGSKKALDAGTQYLLGQNPLFISTLETCDLYAARNTHTLIIGEIGVGKIYFAKMIHDKSIRALKPFITINCNGVTEHNLREQFFGKNNEFPNDSVLDNVMQSVDGTLFVYEISLLPLYLQQFLLNLIKDSSLNIRLIASTNKDLYSLVQQELFLEKLYYALESCIIAVPPLRNRHEDILLLITTLLKKINQNLGTNLTFGKEINRLLIQYSWPGNVLEMENTIAAIAIFGREMSDEVLSVEHLPAEIKSKLYDKRTAYNLERIEKETIQKALKDFSHVLGGKQRVANELGISKMTLYRKIAQYEIIDNDNPE